MFFEKLPFFIAVLLILAIAIFFLGIIALPFYLIYKNNPSLIGLDESNSKNQLTDILAKINNKVGHYCCWMILWISLIQFILVVMRYIFSIGSIPLQESVIYLHGMLFLLVAGYTYLGDGHHVRIDIFYSKMSEKKTVIVNLLGSIFFLAPVLVITWYYAWSYVLNSWAVLETSPEGLGLPFLYIFKTTILIFVILLGIHLAMIVIKSINFLRKKA